MNNNCGGRRLRLFAALFIGRRRIMKENYAKDKVLLLLKGSNDYISGEELSKRMGITRSAIWKYIKALRGEGYEIDSVTNKGYKLINSTGVLNAQDMYNAVTESFATADIAIKAAAVADYTPAEVAQNKIKKADGDANIKLKRTKDILKELGNRKTDKQFVCGFSMETENMLENSKEKLTKKNIDMIVANNLKTEGAGFGTDTNVITLITKESTEQFPIMSKEECAHKIIDKILELKG